MDLNFRAVAVDADDHSYKVLELLGNGVSQ